MKLFLAIILGTFFGYALSRVGASSPQQLVDMLRLRDLRLMKSILLGIGISVILLFIFLTLGIFNPTHLSVKSAYYGVVLGGVLFGIGWSLTGFCPGTAVCAAGSGRKDSLFFILGGLVGAGLYMVTFELIKESFLFTKILGGKITLADTGTSTASLIESVPGTVTAIVFGVVLVGVAFILPEKNKS